jgi:pimeloyl-ACP methyl ester carboxylesterase
MKLMNTEAPRGIQPETRYLERNNTALTEVKEIADIEHFRYGEMAETTLKQVNKALEIYPENERPKIKRIETPPYQLVSFVAKEQPAPGKRVGVVFLSGALGTAAGDAVIPAEIMQRAHRQLDEATTGDADKDPQVAFSLAMSSSVSKDVLDRKSVISVLHPKYTDFVRTAVFQSAFLTEYIKDHPVDEIVLMGHSLGTQEAVRVHALLDNMLQQNGLDTKITATILAHPNGFFEQKLTNFLKGFKKYQLSFLRHEVAEMMPSIFDIEERQSLLNEAWEKLDKQGIERHERVLAEMRNKFHNPPALIPTEIQLKVKDIDMQIGEARNIPGRSGKRAVKKLLKQRFKTLLPVAKYWLQPTDERAHSEGDPPQTLIATVRASLLRRYKNSNVIRSLPDWVADKISGDVSILLGENDVLFPEEVALSEFEKMKKEKALKFKRTNPNASLDETLSAGKLFANADRITIARIANWGHHNPATNATKFAEVSLDLIKRANKAKGEAPAHTAQEIHY